MDIHEGRDAVLVEVRNVSKTFGSLSVLSDVSLTVNRGEVVALLGPNGAGKTTLSALIATVHKATSGDILYEGRSVFEDIIAYRLILGYCPQRTHGDSLFTVRNLLSNAAGYFGVPRDEIDARMRDVAELCAISSVLDRCTNELSGGYRQRVALARSIIHNPKLVIMDEPTVALDPHVRRHIWNMIRLLQDRGIAVLLTTHYLDEAEALANRVCFLNRGKVQRFAAPSELRASYGVECLEEIFMRMVAEVEQV